MNAKEIYISKTIEKSNYSRNFFDAEEYLTQYLSAENSYRWINDLYEYLYKKIGFRGKRRFAECMATESSASCVKIRMYVDIMLKDGIKKEEIINKIWDSLCVEQKK